jgi:hypothetical protein
MTEPTRKRVFLSFAYEDVDQVKGLRLLAANPNYDLEFYDESLQVAVNSLDAEYVRRRIRDKINRSSVTVCLISKTTYSSTWVDWELHESYEQGNTLIAMALKGVDRAVLPQLIRDLQLAFHPWDPAQLTTLISGL